MLRFIVELVVFFAILAVATLPHERVSKIVRRRYDRKKWMRAAGITALFCAVLGWSSRSLQQDCLAERNNGCVDAGGVGTQLVVLGGFVAFALISAYFAYRD